MLEVDFNIKSKLNVHAYQNLNFLKFIDKLNTRFQHHFSYPQSGFIPNYISSDIPLAGSHLL